MYPEFISKNVIEKRVSLPLKFYQMTLTDLQTVQLLLRIQKARKPPSRSISDTFANLC